jgi:hypothetical protein
MLKVVANETTLDSCEVQGLARHPNSTDRPHMRTYMRAHMRTYMQTHLHPSAQGPIRVWLTHQSLRTKKPNTRCQSSGGSRVVVGAVPPLSVAVSTAASSVGAAVAAVAADAVAVAVACDDGAGMAPGASGIVLASILSDLGVGEAGGSLAPRLLRL